MDKLFIYTTPQTELQKQSSLVQQFLVVFESLKEAEDYYKIPIIQGGKVELASLDHIKATVFTRIQYKTQLPEDAIF